MTRRGRAERVLSLLTMALLLACTRANPAFRGVEAGDGGPLADATSPPADAPALDNQGPAPDASTPPAADADADADGHPDAALTSADAPPDASPAPPDSPAMNQPSLTINKATFASGEAIVASFADGPGNATDWIGLYDIDDPPPSAVNRSTAWYYTNNLRVTLAASGPRSGSVTFSDGTAPVWPLPAGSYKAIFFANDGYQILAGPTLFEVR
jgi:hypothetical protein